MQDAFSELRKEKSKLEEAFFQHKSLRYTRFTCKDYGSSKEYLVVSEVH